MGLQAPTPYPQIASLNLGFKRLRHKASTGLPSRQRQSSRPPAFSMRRPTSRTGLRDQRVAAPKRQPVAICSEGLPHHPTGRATDT